jgi:hypothetical protein
MKKEIEYLLSSASNTECTGLMPRPPLTEAEEEAYEDFFPFGIPPIIEKDAE